MGLSGPEHSGDNGKKIDTPDSRENTTPETKNDTKKYEKDFSKSERKLLAAKLGGKKMEDLNTEDVDAMLYLKNDKHLVTLYETILKPDSHLPTEELQKLIKELQKNGQEELHQREFVLRGKDELVRLARIIEGSEEPESEGENREETGEEKLEEASKGEKIQEFLQQQKEQHISADEVFGEMSSGTEKLLAQILSDSGHASVDTFPKELINEQPEAAQSMRRGTLSWLHEQLGTAINKDTKKEDYQNIFDEKVLTKEYKQNREALKEWSEALYADTKNYGPEFFEKSPTFRNPVKYKEFIGKVMDGEIDISQMTPGETYFANHIEIIEGDDREEQIGEELAGINEDGTLKEEVGKPIKELMSDYQDAENMTKLDKISKKFDRLLAGAGELSERIETTVQENFEVFEKLFALPIVGPMLKSWFVSDEAEKPGGWYYEARQEFIEEKGKLSGTEKRLLTTLVGDDKEERSRVSFEDLEGRGDVGADRETHHWYTNKEVPEETGKAIGAFDLDHFATQMTNNDVLEEFSSQVDEGDALHGVDLQEHMLRGMYSKLYSSEEVEGKTQEYASRENLSQDSAFTADLETYASNRVRGLLEDHQTTFEHPQDIANLLFVDLIKGADDYALEYHANNYQGEKTTENEEEKSEESEENNEENENNEKTEIQDDTGSETKNSKVNDDTEKLDNPETST